MGQTDIVTRPMARESVKRKPTARKARRRDRYVPSHEPLAAKWKALEGPQKFSQKELALRIGVSEGAISQFLGGKTKLTVEWQLNFARYMRLAVTDIWPDFPWADLCPGKLSPEAIAVARGWSSISDKRQKDALATLLTSPAAQD